MPLQVFTDPQGFHDAVIAGVVELRNGTAERGTKELVKAAVGAPAKIGPGRIQLRGVVRRTPRLTGEAQNSWELVVDGASVAASPSARAPAEDVVKRLARGIMSTKRPRRVVLVGTAPHIRNLEDGTGRARPSRMLGATGEDLRRIVQ